MKSHGYEETRFSHHHRFSGGGNDLFRFSSSQGCSLLGLCLELSFSVLHCRTQANLPALMHFAEPAIWPSSIRTENPTCANHVDVLTV